MHVQLKKWLASPLLAVALCATAAQAEYDTFGLGTGKDGNLNVAGSGPINTYARVTEPLAPGDTALTLSSSLAGTGSFAAGNLVMVLQMAGLSPEHRADSSEPINLSKSQVGRWELARVKSISGTTLELRRPLLHAYEADVTQVIRVPEYENLTIPAGRSITAAPWDGSTGGVIAFLARGTVTNHGQINASSAGFRGGQYVDDPTPGKSCASQGVHSLAGAQRGEGIDFKRFGPQQTGRNNAANGGGGGACLKSGGGGGGNGGAGGQGGRSARVHGGRNVGGLGGAALAYSLFERLTLGGGGGAGHGTDGSGVPGGQGGGIIFIRAQQLEGTGGIWANGGSGGVALSDGGGGGGAGGTISLRLTGKVECGSISANGGIGGSVNAHQVGPGGGGGGGHVLLQAAGAPCPVSSNGVAAGTQQDVAEPQYSALPGSQGATTLLPSGFLTPAVEVTAPRDGSLTANARPPFIGTATAHATVRLILDGKELEPVTANAAGHFSLPPSFPLAEGAHTLQARSEWQGTSSDEATIRFIVDTTPPDAPRVVTPAHGTALNMGTPAISGTAEPRSLVTIFIDGRQAGSAAADGTGRWTFTPGSALPEGTHEVRARATDPVGNTGPASGAHAVRVDTTPPETEILRSPEARTDSTEAAFDFNATETEVSYECSLDGGAFAPCSASATFSDLAKGSHTLEVKATDAVGNVDTTPASYTWEIQGAQALAFLGGGFGCSTAAGGSPLLALLGLAALRRSSRRRRA